MDKNIVDNRFGITLELSSSIYTFTYHGTPHKVIQTQCQYAKDYIVANVPDLIELCPLHYVCPTETELEQCRSALDEYYVTTNNQCIEL